MTSFLQRLMRENAVPMIYVYYSYQSGQTCSNSRESLKRPTVNNVFCSSQFSNSIVLLVHLFGSWLDDLAYEIGTINGVTFSYLHITDNSGVWRAYNHLLE